MSPRQVSFQFRILRSNVQGPTKIILCQAVLLFLQQDTSRAFQGWDVEGVKLKDPLVLGQRRIEHPLTLVGHAKGIPGRGKPGIEGQGFAILRNPSWPILFSAIHVSEIGVTPSPFRIQKKGLGIFLLRFPEPADAEEIIAEVVMGQGAFGVLLKNLESYGFITAPDGVPRNDANREEKQ